MDGRTIIQWDKYDLDYFRVAQSRHFIVGYAFSFAKNLRYGSVQSFIKFPPMTEKPIEMIRRADTVGTFQIESRAQMSYVGSSSAQRFL